MITIKLSDDEDFSIDIDIGEDYQGALVDVSMNHEGKVLLASAEITKEKAIEIIKGLQNCFELEE